MKNLILVFVLAMSTSVFACGGSDKSADSTSSTSTTESESTEASG